ncbi:carboxypeptidase-like regulatory domain-containing protein [Paludibaculum fermentans]|uniref:carboxypeptidase-like regulatory domain-containing protein n=1 Tax=Paludibaculum fermentans TaxID=1473598 RepID=UPI003EBE558A
MKVITLALGLLLGAWSVTGQTKTGSISGFVLERSTLQPVPAALIMAFQDGSAPSAKNTQTGADGAFLIQDLSGGTYTICVQAGEAYLDTCQWTDLNTSIVLAPGETSTGILVKLAAASILAIEVRDAQKLTSQITKDGRRPELSLGVWGPKGLYHPAYPVATVPAPHGTQNTMGANTFHISIPRDTPLNFYAGSRDLVLGDANGAVIAGSENQQAFQHRTGDAKPPSFTLTVLGQKP